MMDWMASTINRDCFINGAIMKEACVSPCRNGDRRLETEDVAIFQSNQLQKCKSDTEEDARVLQSQQDLPSVLLSLLDIGAERYTLLPFQLKWKSSSLSI